VSVSCSKCGQEWERDPALEVTCPTCGADVGQRCRRPSGHPAELHAPRDKKALREVDGYGRCPATPADETIDIDEAHDESPETTQTRLSAVSDGVESA
jgi:DNA-directed RNA polymerase subunit RPC12/RpoP